MTTQGKKWGNLWGNLNWKEVTPADIDACIARGADVDMVEKKTFPLGYDHKNPLIEAMRANNPVAFSHLIQRGADLNFRLPYANLYPEGARYGNHSVITDAPSMLYVKYATQKGMRILPEHLLDIESHKGGETEKKLSFILDFFEKRKNSKECLSVLRILPRLRDTQFLVERFSTFLDYLDKKDVLAIPENIRTDRVLKKRVLQAMGNKKRRPNTQRIKD